MVETTKVFLFKKEATYRTDPTPTMAANAVLSRNFSAKPVAVDRIDRKLDRHQNGRTKDAPSNARQTISYELEITGSGDAGTAAPWMEHLEACGMGAPLLVADTSAEQRFTPIGTALSSGAAYHWVGNQKAIGLGGRGTYSWDFTAGQYPFFKIDLTLLLSEGAPDPIDNTPAAPVLDRWIDPLEINDANTEFLLGGYAAVLKSFTGDANATIAVRNLVGARYVRHGNHGITVKIMIETPAIASKNYFATLRSGDEIPFSLTHGTEDGNIFEMKSDHLQITDIERQEDDDVAMLSITAALNIGSTNDDLILIVK